MNKFRSNLKPAELKTLIKMRSDGASWKDTLAKTELSHSKAELAWFEHERFGGEEPGVVLNLTGSEVVTMREAGLGWGQIMVATQSSEGAVRKAWREATGTHSDGQRVNHGGRFKFDEGELYVGSLKPTGTSIPSDQPLVREVARSQALTARLLALEPAALKRIFVKHSGETPGKGWTKAKLIIEIGKAAQAKGQIVQVEEPQAETVSA